MGEDETTSGWYWDLIRRRAMRGHERGPADQVMGPYPTREAAEAWRDRVDQRNEAWDADDEEWGRWREDE